MHSNDFELIDFHTHVLPGIDDGSKSVEMSAEMLKLLKQQGVGKVVASPHFCKDICSIDEFCSRRKAALESLKEYIQKEKLDLPEIIPAAEVKLTRGLWKVESIGRLCVGSSGVMLVEMPYEKWTDWMYNEVYALCAKGYLPVIVHVERYLKDYASQEDILKKLLKMQVFVQCNAESVGEMRKRNLIKKIIKLEKLAALGSDTHNMSVRKPNFDVITKYICQKYGSDFLNLIMKRSATLLGEDAFNLI